MSAIPPALRDQLKPKVENTIDVTMAEGRTVVNPKLKTRYKLAELLAASDYSQPQSLEEREWVDAAAVGNELI